ncbi:hypothetical protein GTW67_07665 [Streptomyces sp. SID5910]|nr:hypothetical protein [Streptomyces sp. SID5910]
MTASTPFFWLLADPGTGQLVGASVQGATGVAALVWALMQPSATAQSEFVATDTGRAEATGGGRTTTGVRRPSGTGRATVRVERTGDATSDGPGSSANSGVDLG